MILYLPENALVLLVGTSSSGKSSFSRKLFKPTEVVSSDYCRALVSDDENNQAASADAFELLNLWASKRLKRGLLTVIDATNVNPYSRKNLLNLASSFNVPCVALVFDLPLAVMHDRLTRRTDRIITNEIIARQYRDLQKNIATIDSEGFSQVITFTTESDINAVSEVVREAIPADKKAEESKLDIIGDVHGCIEELLELLALLHYRVEKSPARYTITPPDGRRLVFVGDLVDRGPDSPAVLQLVMNAVADGVAYCVLGNHDDKLLRKLKGANVKLTHGLDKTIEQLEARTPEFVNEVMQFLNQMPYYLMFNNGRLVVAHAGISADMIGRYSGQVKSFCLYGATNGQLDELGLPVRLNWQADYHGKALIVYGHTPVANPKWERATVDIDTGCVFGGKLTAMSYPERQFTSVPAKCEYAVASRPFLV